MIPYGRHSIGIRDIISVVNSLKSDWLTTGPRVEQFEILLSEVVGAPCLTVTSGTAALHCAYAAIGLQENDEIITPPITFVATQATARMFGAKIVFADVQADTLNIDPKHVENLISKRTKAIVAVDYAGHPADLNELRKIADKHSIFLIEDASESLGSFYKNKHTGTFGQLGTLSFNGNKIITAGGGGCIITNDKLLAKKAKHLTTVAKVPHKWDFSHDMTGYNYRMPNLNAALLVAQLENLKLFIKNKRKLAEVYEAFFLKVNYNFFKEPKNCKSNYWLNSILFQNKQQRDKFLEETNSNGVITRPIWILMNRLPMFKNSQCGNIKNSEWLFERVVNIPSNPKIS